MGQRVNLQFSVDIEELPNEIQRLIKKNSNQLYNCYELSDRIEDSEEIFSINTIQKIDMIRQNLASVDQSLADAQNIVKGFLNFITNSEPAVDPDIYGNVDEPLDVDINEEPSEE
mgnify:CR=1 FL=1